ncbi:MAG: cellulase family glycosylhydrolase [Anaerolineae bacterium]
MQVHLNSVNVSTLKHYHPKHLRQFVQRSAVIPLLMLFAACSSVDAPSPTPAPVYSPIAPILLTSAGPAAPIIGQLGAVADSSATPISIQTLPPTVTPQPHPSESMMQPTFGAVVAPDDPLPPTSTPTPSHTPTAIAVVLGQAPNITLDASLMGVQIHGFLTDAEFEQMLDRTAELGVQWVKFQIAWDLYEPHKGQFNDFYRARVLQVQRASVRGFKTLISISRAPDWARPPAVRGVESGPPENPQDLAAFVGRFVRDTKPEFIDAVEIWSEANLIREWTGLPLSGEEYMRHFRAAHAAIRAAEQQFPSALKPNHRITVITAGAAPTITFPDGTTIGDVEWLQGLYNAGLAEFGADVALGAHSYGWANPPEARCCTASPGVTGWYEHPTFYFRETLERYRQVMLANNHANAKLWVTEFGWATYDGLTRSDGSVAQPSADYGWQRTLTAAQQARYLVNGYALAQSAPYADYVATLIVWNLNFATIPGMVDNSREEAGFSLLDSRSQPRLAFEALKAVAKR